MLMSGDSEAYFSKEADSVLPDYRINNIIVEKKSIRLFCSLDRDEDLGQDSWLGSSDFLKYVNFYFVLTGKLSSTSISKVYYPKTRVQSLKYGNGAAALLRWEDSFKLQSTPIPGDPTRERRGFGIINPIFGFIKVNMDEISRGNSFISNTKKSFGALSATSLLDGSGFNNIGPTDDTFFEVEMACDDDWLFNDESGMFGSHHRNIVSFCHLDVGALAKDYNLSNFVGTLSQYGGPMHYEKILELSPDGDATGRGRLWQVPRTINYFEDQQGNPHKGLAHYHNQSNPGPGGYIGWMSGPPGGDMAGRKLLSRREIKNTKVVSKIHLGAALGFDGMPLTDENRFLGYPDSLSTVGGSIPSPYGNLNFGENLLSALRSEVGLGMLEVESAQSRFAPGTIRGNKLKNLVLAKESAKSPSFVDYIATSLDVDENYYSTYFLINKEAILKQNSEFGYLLDFHRQEMPSEFLTDRPFRGEFDTPRKESYNFLKNCTENSEVYTMTVKRKRLENFSSINNSAAVADYTSYDNNKVEEVLVKYSNSNDRLSFNDAGNKAEIGEIARNAYSKIGFHTFFKLKDFELYRNVTHGRYRYTIEVSMVDGVKKYLRGLYRKYFAAVKEFEKYVTEASKPYLRDHNHWRGSIIMQSNRGSYDYEKEEFSRIFKNRSGEFSNTITDVVTSYMKVSYIFNKNTSFFTRNFKQELINMLTPDTADIGNLKMFLDLLHKVGSSIKEKIFKAGTDIERTLNFGTHKRRVGSGNQMPNGLITVNSDLAGNVKVESKNSVFYTVGEDPNGDLPEVTEFFTLQSNISEETLSESESTEPAVEFPITFNSEGETINRKTFYTRRVIGPLQDNYSEIISATQYSEYGESYDTRSEQHTNPLNNHNLTVSNFGGASFNYLLTKTLSVAETSTNECGEAVSTVSPTVEQAIFDSIVTTDNRDDFLEQVEEQYKDYYFTRESLGSLYDFMKHTMSNRNVLSSMNTNQTENRLQRYRHRVERGTSTENHRAQTNKLRREQINTASSMLTDLYVYTISNGFVLAETNPDDASGIFERRQKGNIKTSDGKSPVITNSVYVSQSGFTAASGATTRQSALSRGSGPGPIAGPNRTRAPSLPSGTTTTGGGTSGY